MICRLKLDKAEEGFTYVIEALKKIHGIETEDLLSVVKFKHELANMHLQKVDTRNKKVYDAKDRPGQLAIQSREIVERILGEDDPYNYLRAKAIAQIGKCELVKKN